MENIQNKITPSAIIILKKNFFLQEGESLFSEFVKQESNNDPNFFNWLFPHAENISDFASGITEEQRIKANEFFDSLTKYD